MSGRLGCSLTLATGGLVTVIIARPDFPSAFAAICEVPTANHERVKLKRGRGPSSRVRRQCAEAHAFFDLARQDIWRKPSLPHGISP